MRATTLSRDVEIQLQPYTNTNTSTQNPPSKSNHQLRYGSWKFGMLSKKTMEQDTSRPEPVTAIARWLRKAAIAVSFLFMALFLFAKHFPPIIFSIFFTGKAKYWMKDVTSSSLDANEGADKRSSIYKRKKRKPEPVRDQIEVMSVVTATRLGIIVLIWLSINLSVPSLREAHLLGSPLWKWSVLATVVLLLIPAMLVASFILVTHYEKDDIENNDFGGGYYWISGVEGSLRWVFYFALILVVWLLYFFSNLGEIKQILYRRIHKYIILTIVACLIGAILGLIRNIVVLWWKSKFIYNTYNKTQILVTAFRLYLLLLLSDEMSDHPFKIWWILMPYYTPQHQGVYDDNLRNKAHPIEQFMLKMSEQVSLHNIDEAANWITQRFDLSEDVIPTNLGSESLQLILDKHKEKEGTADVLIANTSPLDRDFLLELLQLDSGKFDTTNKDLTKTEVGEWMNVAHKQCFVYINKLHGRLGSAKILLKVLAVSQIVATIIFWLFITQLATTKLVLTLGSLFLGLTFMFGDTCKTFFQGVIFSFVAHPFDVGDLVEIDGIKLEVKKINMLTTIFRIEDSGEILIYPNSAIFTVKITKLRDNNNTMTLSGFKRLLNDWIRE